MKTRLYHIFWIVPAIAIAIFSIRFFVTRPNTSSVTTAQTLYTTTSSDFAVETVAGGLNSPVAAAFTPDGRIFITEKAGNVRVISNGVLLSEPLVRLDNVSVHGDHGLLGIAVDPNFETNGYIYLSYTYENNPSDEEGPKTGQIIRLTVTGDTANLDSKTIVMGSVVGNEEQPSCNDFPKTSDCIPSDAGSHSVGVLRFGSDGKLYASLADASGFDEADPDALRALDLDILAGKIIRINTNGTAPPDNPFYNGDPNANRSKVYAYGVRNSFRFNFRPLNNALYIGEVGWYVTDEINLGSPGANYGWPCREGLGETQHYECTTEDYVDPLYTIPNEHTATSTFAIMGGAFSGAAYPAPYQDNYFFGIFGKDYIKRMVFDKDNKALIPAEDFILGADGPVDFITGPDGSIYFVSIYTGELRRIVYAPNKPPTVVAKAQPQIGIIPLTVTFSGEKMQDSRGTITSYHWDFGDGSTSTQQYPEHTYTQPGVYNVTFEARNDTNTTSTAYITIRASAKNIDNADSSIQLLQTSVIPKNMVVAEQTTISAIIGNASSTEPILIDIEIHDDKGGSHVAQQYYDNIMIDPGAQQTFKIGWIPKNPGTYKVSVGLYSAGWGELKQWIDNALTFTIQARRPEGT